jgi:TonB family protein
LTLFSETKYDESLSKVKKGLEIRERLLPRTDARIVNSLIYLGDIYLVKRDFGEAKKVLERLLAIMTERSGPEHVSLAPTMDRLALVYYRQGDARKSEDMYQRALASREKAFGAESDRVAHSLYSLGEFYRAERAFERAASSYRRSLLIYGKLSGINTPEFEQASDGYSCLGYEDKKLNVQKDLKEIRKQFAPPKTPDESLETRVLNGMALSLPKPDYPREALERNLAGIVVVKVQIDETGKVISAKDICQGPPYLSQSSVASALKARFSPTKLSGMPVKVNGVIVYNFVRR